MSPRTQKPVPPGPYYLATDLERPHGPHVRLCGAGGRDLGWLDRPLAELVLELLAERARAA